MARLLEDLRLCLAADRGQPRLNPKTVWRAGRRMIKRCWRDRVTIDRPRIFCQNSGGCGSSYIVRLLIDNGVERCFHERTPDLNEIGIEHFGRPSPDRRLVRSLRYTRHDVYFEANNRLFSLSRQIGDAFPAARFIHLHRHPAEAVRSALSKPDVERYLAENVRFQGSLAGPKSAAPLVRFCHYWANINRRILDDLADREFLSLKFDDLTSGRINRLEQFLGQSLPTRQRPAVNVGGLRHEGRYDAFEDWPSQDRSVLKSICGPVMRELGYR